MTMEKKDLMNCWLAVGLAISGAVLCFVAFFCSQDGEIASTVLWYFAQTLIYAATAFGMKSYIDFLLKKNGSDGRKDFDLDKFREQ